jgi:hypothetical protein
MWRDTAWVLDMLLASRKAVGYARGLGEEQFQASSLHQDAILRQLTIVGEAANVCLQNFVPAIPRCRGGKSPGSAMSSCAITLVWTCKRFGGSFRRTYQPW